MRPLARIAVPAMVVLLMAVACVDHFFRDEFYYLACTHHMAWGYVDQPPLSVAVLWVVRHLAGESLLALRLVAALALAGSIWLTGSVARRLGAGAFGELLAMVAMAIPPELLAIGSFYSMNVFDLLFWTAAAVLAGNYGEAGALERLAHLPAISRHSNYWLWGPGGRTGEVLLVLTKHPERLERSFASVKNAGEIECGDCMPYENHLGIYIVRQIHAPLAQIWDRLKHYD